jgi:hypothetical protein
MQARCEFFLEAFWAVSSCDASISALHNPDFVMQIMQGYAARIARTRMDSEFTFAVFLASRI